MFKPHPDVYRTAARILESEPSEIMMVAAHSFDIMGAVACGYSGAFVNRYGLPYEDTTKYVPALVVDDFIELGRGASGGPGVVAAASDVVVVGGGVVGTAIAYFASIQGAIVYGAGQG